MYRLMRTEGLVVYKDEYKPFCAVFLDYGERRPYGVVNVLATKDLTCCQEPFGYMNGTKYIRKYHRILHPDEMLRVFRSTNPKKNNIVIRGERTNIPIPIVLYVIPGVQYEFSKRV